MTRGEGNIKRAAEFPRRFFNVGKNRVTGAPNATESRESGQDLSLSQLAAAVASGPRVYNCSPSMQNSIMAPPHPRPPPPLHTHTRVPVYYCLCYNGAHGLFFLHSSHNVVPYSPRGLGDAHEKAPSLSVSGGKLEERGLK